MTNESNNTGFQIEGWKDLKPWNVHNGHCGIGHNCYTLIPIIYDNALSLYENVCKAFQYISDINGNLEALKAYLAGLQEQIMEWIKEGVAEELAKQLPPLLQELYQKIDDLEATLRSEFQTDLVNLKTELETDIDSLKAELEMKIYENAQDILTLQTSVSSINTRLTQIEGQITNISGDITSINTSVTQLQNSISDLQADVSENITNIDSLLSAVGSINDSIGNIMSDIANIKTRLNTLENAGYMTEDMTGDFINNKLGFNVELDSFTSWTIGGTYATRLSKAKLKNAIGICFSLASNQNELYASKGQIYPVPTDYSLGNYYVFMSSKRFDSIDNSPLDFHISDCSLRFNQNTGYFDLKMGKVWEAGADNMTGSGYSDMTAKSLRYMQFYFAVYVVYPMVLAST